MPRRATTPPIQVTPGACRGGRRPSRSRGRPPPPAAGPLMPPSDRGGRRGRYGRYRYGPWQGGADPLAPPDDVRQALDALGEEVLAGSGLREALREMLRRGLPDEAQGSGRNLNRQGLDDLRARAMRMRREVARRGRLDG